MSDEINCPKCKGLVISVNDDLMETTYKCIDCKIIFTIHYGFE